MNTLQFPMLASGLSNTMTKSPEQQQVEQMMLAFQQQLQSQQAPQMEQVLQAPGAVQTFLSQLLGNLGSALAQNPMYSQQAAGALEGRRQESEGARLRNAHREEAFQIERKSAFLKLAEKRLDVAIDGAKERGDLQAEKELAELKARLIKEQHEADFQHNLSEINARRQSQIDVENTRESNRQKPKPAKISISQSSGGGGKGGGGKTAKLTPSQIETRSKAVADKLVKPDLLGNIDQKQYSYVQDSVRTELTDMYNTEGVKPDKTEKTRVGKTAVGDLKEIGQTMLNGKRYAGLRGAQKLQAIHKDIESMKNLSPEAKSWTKRYVGLLSRGK